MDLSLLEIWMAIVGVSMALSGIPQIIRLLKRKSSEDVSLLFFLIILHAQFWWIYYAIVKQSLSLLVTNGLSIIGSVTIVWLILKYRRKE